MDAGKLADLPRTNLLSAIWIPDAETRARRTLLPERAWIARADAGQGPDPGQTERVPVSDLFGPDGRAWLTIVPLRRAVREPIDRSVALAEHLDAMAG